MSVEYQSIFEEILSNIDGDGKLANNFRSSFDESDGLLLPGERDTLLLFEVDVNGEQVAANKLVKTLQKVHKHLDADAYQQIMTILDEYPVVLIYKDLISQMIENYESFDHERLVDMILTFTLYGTDIEIVKLGIVLVGLLNVESDDPLVESVYNLAKYSEFTFLAIVFFEICKLDQDSLLELAQLTSNFGRVHVIPSLDSRLSNVQDWLLCEAYTDSKADGYIAFLLGQILDLDEYVNRNKLTIAQFRGLLNLFAINIEHENHESIELFDTLVRAFVRHIPKQCRTLQDVAGIIILMLYMIEHNDIFFENEILICETVVKKEEWVTKVKQEFKRPTKAFESAFDVAEALKLDVHDALFDLIEKYPLEYSRYAYMLFDDENRAKAVVAVYEEVIPESMITTMELYEYRDMSINPMLVLIDILECIANYPYLGKRLVIMALQAPAYPLRISACTVLQSWCDELVVELKQLDEELYNLVSECYELEEEEDLDDMYEQLLNTSIKH